MEVALDWACNVEGWAANIKNTMYPKARFVYINEVARAQQQNIIHIWCNEVVRVDAGKM